MAVTRSSTSRIRCIATDQNSVFSGMLAVFPAQVGIQLRNAGAGHAGDRERGAACRLGARASRHPGSAHDALRCEQKSGSPVEDDMIPLKNVERSYKTKAGQTGILRRINLEIHEGEFITVMGPSGPGKSSLLKCSRSPGSLTPKQALPMELALSRCATVGRLGIRRAQQWRQAPWR